MLEKGCLENEEEDSNEIFLSIEQFCKFFELNVRMFFVIFYYLIVSYVLESCFIKFGSVYIQLCRLDGVFC